MVFLSKSHPIIIVILNGIPVAQYLPALELQIWIFLFLITPIGIHLVAGRFEFFTKRHRVILCPLEELKIQNHKKSLTIKKVEILNYKPGLYLQVLSFINEKNDLVKIEDHANSLWYYLKINGNK